MGADNIWEARMGTDNIWETMMDALMMSTGTRLTIYGRQ